MLGLNYDITCMYDKMFADFHLPPDEIRLCFSHGLLLLLISPHLFIFLDSEQ